MLDRYVLGYILGLGLIEGLCYGSVTQELVSRTRVSMRKKKKKKSKGSASIFLIPLALFTRLFIMLPNN